MSLLTDIDPQDIAVIATGFGTFIGALLVARRGAKTGTPTTKLSGSYAAETLAAIADRVADIETSLRELRDILIRIEDRTKR